MKIYLPNYYCQNLVRNCDDWKHLLLELCKRVSETAIDWRKQSCDIESSIKQLNWQSAAYTSAASRAVWQWSGLLVLLIRPCAWSVSCDVPTHVHVHCCPDDGAIRGQFITAGWWPERCFLLHCVSVRYAPNESTVASLMADFSGLTVFIPFTFWIIVMVLH